MVLSHSGRVSLCLGSRKRRTRDVAAHGEGGGEYHSTALCGVSAATAGPKKEIDLAFRCGREGAWLLLLGKRSVGAHPLLAGPGDSPHRAIARPVWSLVWRHRRHPPSLAALSALGSRALRQRATLWVWRFAAAFVATLALQLDLAATLQCWVKLVGQLDVGVKTDWDTRSRHGALPRGPPERNCVDTPSAARPEKESVNSAG